MSLYQYKPLFGGSFQPGWKKMIVCTLLPDVPFQEWIENATSVIRYETRSHVPFLEGAFRSPGNRVVFQKSDTIPSTSFTVMNDSGIDTKFLALPAFENTIALWRTSILRRQSVTA